MENKQETLTIEESHNLTISFYNMQSRCIVEINNMNRIAPSILDYDLPQPEFNEVFTGGITEIKSHMAKAVSFYVLILIRKMPLYKDEDLSEDAMSALHIISERVVTDDFMNNLVMSTDLLEDPPFSIFSVLDRVIKINQATGNLILQQMSPGSYYMLCHQIKNIHPVTVFHLAQECVMRMGFAPTVSGELTYGLEQ